MMQVHKMLTKLTFIFQHMDKDDDAYAAVKGLDGTFFAGSNIKVEVNMCGTLFLCSLGP